MNTQNSIFINGVSILELGIIEIIDYPSCMWPTKPNK